MQANTNAVVYASKAVHHTEGGWPKEVDHLEAEHVIRFRKKVLHFTPIAAQCIPQQVSNLHAFGGCWPAPCALHLITTSLARGALNTHLQAKKLHCHHKEGQLGVLSSRMT